jgi:hypothetical protein
MLKYITLNVEVATIQLEGAIADSYCPRIKNGEVWYNEYAAESIDPSVGQDILIF